VDRSIEGVAERGVIREKVMRLAGDRVTNYICYDNYNNNAYINLAYWEHDLSRVIGFLVKGQVFFWKDRGVSPLIFIS